MTVKIWDFDSKKDCCTVLKVCYNFFVESKSSPHRYNLILNIALSNSCT